jgi:hypothetical protein
MLLTGCLLIFFVCSNVPGKTGKNVGEKDFQLTGKYLNVMTPVILYRTKR